MSDNWDKRNLVLSPTPPALNWGHFGELLNLIRFFFSMSVDTYWSETNVSRFLTKMLLDHGPTLSYVLIDNIYI